MYNIKDNVVYNGFKCFIGQVLGGGRYTVIANNKDFVIEVYEKDLEPVDSNRYEVRHVIFDTKDNKIVNDAMGECYITLAEAQEVCNEMNAPKVMKPKYTKEVEYFGMRILVPDGTKWLATSSNGVVLGSDTKMEFDVCGWFHKQKIYNVGVVDLNGIDWKDTLMEIK